MVRPYRGVPYRDQPHPWGKRCGETFDACISWRYKYVGERSRTVVKDAAARQRMYPLEDFAYSGLVASGVLHETNLGEPRQRD
eukprot:1670625-Alexandrium_andersonii.AAC.1